MDTTGVSERSETTGVSGGTGIISAESETLAGTQDGTSNENSCSFYDTEEMEIQSAAESQVDSVETLEIPVTEEEESDLGVRLGTEEVSCTHSETDTTNINSQAEVVLGVDNDVPAEVGITNEGNIENDDETVTETEGETTASYYCWKYDVQSEVPECLITSSATEFRNESSLKKSANYMKGCKWAPDGSCLLTNSDDDYLRVFNFPNCFSSVQDWNAKTEIEPLSDTEQWCSALKVKEGGQVYDYCWYPLMSSVDPVSSCFITSSSQAPIHLWDAFTGKLRASYLPIDHLEQLVSPYSLAFDPTGELIYSGYEKCIRIFNITRPGRQCTMRTLKHKLPDLNQYGIVGSVAVNPSMRSIYAVGTFDKSVGLYYEDGSVICLLQGHIGGITHLKFSSDGLKLFSGGRKDSRLICWDVRKMGEAYKIFDRKVTTHQRIYFDITPDNRYLVTGGTDGRVIMWDLHKEEESEISIAFEASRDCVNGTSLNPYVPLLATSSGQRHFVDIADDSDEELFVKSHSTNTRSCDIKLWKLV